MATSEQSASAIGSALQAYAPALAFTRLVVGVDNIRHDVFLSPRWREQASQFLFENVLHQAQPHLREIYPSDPRSRSAATGEFKRRLGKVLQEALTRAKEHTNIEIDLLARLGLYKWLLGETQRQFSEISVAGKERIEKKGSLHFQSSMASFVLHSRISEYHSNRRHILRGVGETLFQIFEELEDNNLRPARSALFGSEFADFYQVVRNRLIFLENPNDAVVHLEHYVMLGHFGNDVDLEERVRDVLAQLLREQGLALPEGDELARLEQRLEKTADQLQEVNHRLRELELELEEIARPESAGRRTIRWLSGRSGADTGIDRVGLERNLKALEAQREQLAREVEELEQKVAFLRQTHETRLSEVMSNPANAERLFGGLSAQGTPELRTEAQEALLRQLHMRLERAGMLPYVLASYHLKSIYKDFCPPLNPQQLKRAVVDRQGWQEFETLLDQFPARNFPVEKLEEMARRLRRLSRADTETILVRFVRDLMRLGRDFLHLHLLQSLMEKIHLVEDEKTRHVSQLNRTLYEFVLSEEREAGEEHVRAHVVVKADVRDSSRITEELLRRGLNPATHFSFNFYEPVHKLAARYSASKIFIEGDALILGIYETESNRASQRPVAKACLLAKEIVNVCQAYNERARANDLPVLELGLGIAFQDSPPHYWADGEARIMISAALNESDRLASCTRMARKLVGENSSQFFVFLLQGEPAPDEEEEFLLRYNIMGVSLNEPGFQKLQQEISLSRTELSVDSLGGKEKVTLHHGTVPIGNSFEKLIVREARIPRFRLPERQVADWTSRTYYEVCVHPKLYERFP
ncbi:MAG: hypothetical protein HY656_09500 [Acidobacteria bacterium]|nr:hypothetical protein [Acidobacteriota bacterium]